MDYTSELNKYIIDLMVEYHKEMTVKSTPKFIYFELIIDKDDSLLFIINRDINKKCYYKFRNGCPDGQFDITNKMKKLLMKSVKRRGFFSLPISR